MQEEEKICHETWKVKGWRNYKEFGGGFPERLDVFQEREKQRVLQIKKNRVIKG